MKVLVVVNPISGGIDKEPFLRHVNQTFEKYGIEGKVFKTTGVDDDQKLKNHLEEFEPDRIASLGGDGTTLFTAQNIMHTDYPFGIIPLGSANGMAVELGIDRDPKVALTDFLQSHRYAPLDLILVNEKYYCLHLGDVGVNARIVENYSKEEGRGMFTYAKHFLAEISDAEILEYDIEADGRK